VHIGVDELKARITFITGAEARALRANIIVELKRLEREAVNRRAARLRGGER
jgi:hypothetical protein